MLQANFGKNAAFALEDNLLSRVLFSPLAQTWHTTHLAYILYLPQSLPQFLPQSLPQPLPFLLHSLPTPPHTPQREQYHV